MLAVIHDEDHAIFSVMRGRNRFHDYLADLFFPRTENAEGRRSRPMQIAWLLRRSWRWRKLAGRTAMQNAHAAAVVNMVVGNQHRIDCVRIPAMQGKPFLHLAAADPGVEKRFTPLAST